MRDYNDIFGQDFEWCKLEIGNQIDKFEVINELPTKGGLFLL